MIRKAIPETTASTVPGPSLAKAYSYLRFSSPEQAKGASRRRQIEAAEKWAAENGHVLDEQLRDEGISAFRGKHRRTTSALGGFLKRIESGDVAAGSYLIVESFDRLSREEVVDALEQFLTLTRQGITVVTLADGRVYNRESLKRDQTQLIISIVIMARAYEESATKSLRVGHAWSAKREAARRTKQAMTATCPGWIRLVGGPKSGHYELIEERAEIVRSMFVSVIAGQGRRTISKRLNADRVEPWGMGGNKGVHWHDSYVQKVLNSPATFGRLDLRGDVIDGYFPAVITEDVYWKAKAATSSRYFGSGRSPKRFNNLLQGMVTCKDCGANMQYVDKGKRSKPFLRCSSAMASSGCASTTVAAYADLEALVVNVYAHFTDAVLFALKQNSVDASQEIEAFETRLAQMRSRCDNLAVAIADGGESGALRKLLDATEMQRAALERQLAELNAKAAANAGWDEDLHRREGEIYAQLISGDDEHRLRMRTLFNARLRHFIDRLVINEQGTGFTIAFKPGINPVDPFVRIIEDPRTWEDFLADEAKADAEIAAMGDVDYFEVPRHSDGTPVVLGTPS